MGRLILFLETRSRPFVALLIALLVIFATALELMSPAAFPSELFYLPPIIFAAWYGGRLIALVLVAVSAVIWLLLYPGAHTGFWHGLAHFLLYVLIALTIDAFRTLYGIEQHRAGSDQLTGLANATSFRQRLQDEFVRAGRYRHPTTLIYLDVDNFKVVNDRWGHAAGDDLLQQIAGVLQRTRRRTDVAARIGGDEFAILLTETGEGGAASAASDIRDNLMRAIRTTGYPVTFSIGAATFPTPPGDVETALRIADRLMYRAKHGGKDKIVAGRIT